MEITISCLQTNIFPCNPELNIEHMKNKLMEAMNKAPDIVVMPELWTTGYDLERFSYISDAEGSITKSFLSKWAKAYNIHIVGGSVAKRTNQGIYNTMYVVNRNGRIIHEYSKLHLFRLMDEDKYLQSGQDDSYFELPGIPACGVICYDIRFPEWIRISVLKGAKILFVAAEWPKQRLDHWRTLLLARAIENQCFVVACNRVGSDGKNDFAGHSIIIDPWGEVMAEGGEQEEIVTAKIDLNKVVQVREMIPVFADRRPDFYTCE